MSVLRHFELPQVLTHLSCLSVPMQTYRWGAGVLCLVPWPVWSGSPSRLGGNDLGLYIHNMLCVNSYVSMTLISPVTVFLYWVFANFGLFTLTFMNTVFLLRKFVFFISEIICAN